MGSKPAAAKRKAKPKAKLGRPTRGKGPSSTWSIRWTAFELEQIERRATAVGMTAREYVRIAALLFPPLCECCRGELQSHVHTHHCADGPELLEDPKDCPHDLDRLTRGFAAIIAGR